MESKYIRILFQVVFFIEGRPAYFCVFPLPTVDFIPIRCGLAINFDVSLGTHLRSYKDKIGTTHDPIIHSTY